jgi:hypothetical protein
MSSEIWPGWYPDPTSQGSMRWWDGTTWTTPPQLPVVTEFPPQDRSPGWKADPWGIGSLRYWDGISWVDHTR